MCGIAGILSSQQIQSRKSEVQKMLDLIRHRGPDGEGIVESSFGTIGHVRLSILDSTSAAAQPFTSDGLVLSYNGEIYNYQELKKDLSDRPFISHSDTEVLFNALYAFGLDTTLKSVRGMFAFCWHNQSNGETYLVRDRFGIKPLFYAITPTRELIFASELKSILAVLQQPINEFKAVYSVMGGLERDGHGTAWQGIYQVPPGHYLHFKNGTIELIRYFSITDYVDETTYRELNRMNQSDLVYQLDGLLRQAVDDMGMGDIPAGSFMSGGVDSGLISYYGKYSNPEIKLFSSDVDGHQSEAFHARLNAKAIGSNLLFSTYRDNQCIGELVSTTWHYESPLVVHFNAMPLSGLARLAQQMSTKAVLTGEGSDELFIGYPHLVGGGVDSLLSAPYRLLDYLYSKLPGFKRFKEKKNFGISLQNMIRNSSEGVFMDWLQLDESDAYSFLSEDERSEHLQTAVMMKSHLLSLLWRNDRMGMMHSIESRFPFLDERVVQFAMNLPHKHKVSFVTNLTSWKHPFQSGKHLVRLVASRYLPSKITFGEKKGFPVQGLHLLSTDHEFFKNGFLASTLGLDTAGLDNFFHGLDNYHRSLFGMVEIWSKLFIEGKSLDEVNNAVLKNFSYKPN
ncbi:MAG: asparagine synthase (glutamine-hydrolyzing) [Bacteroidota bacterium]|jgi:asparagine synthase (glutamine-hydrolysing)